MFYTKCKKCSTVRRWLTLAETQDEELVDKNKTRPVTLEEFEAAQEADIGKNPKVDILNVIDACCYNCEPKAKSKKKKEAVEA
jgi:hypothetical protein